MSREVLHETLSAVMDNEADELELRRVLAATDDAELRAKWGRYQLARSAMQKETPELGFDISGAVAAAIAEDEQVALVEGKKPSRWYQLGRVAVAATVTLAVLAGVRFYNHEQAPELAQQADEAANRAVASAAAPVEGGALAAPHEQQASDFIRQHAQTASLQQEEELDGTTAQ